MVVFISIPPSSWLSPPITSPFPASPQCTLSIPPACSERCRNPSETRKWNFPQPRTYTPPYSIPKPFLTANHRQSQTVPPKTPQLTMLPSPRMPNNLVSPALKKVCGLCLFTSSLWLSIRHCQHFVMSTNLKCYDLQRTSTVQRQLRSLRKTQNWFPWSRGDLGLWLADRLVMWSLSLRPFVVV